MELVKRRHRLSEPEAAYFGIQLLDAMRYLHNHNIIHRDLKLGNLFLTHDLQIRVGDFGLATHLKTRDERKKTVCGTPNYIAPEILDQKGHSFEVDTWAFGVILYTMLIGKPPFETADVKTTYKKIRENSYDFPAEYPISADAKDLITQILQPDPQNRPSIEAILHHPFFSAPQVYLPLTLPQTILTTRPTFRHEDLVPGMAIVQDILSKPVLPLKSTINMSPVENTTTTTNNENINPNRMEVCTPNIGMNNNSNTSNNAYNNNTNIPPLVRTNSAPSSTMPLHHYSNNEDVHLTRSNSVSNSGMASVELSSNQQLQQKQSFQRPPPYFGSSSSTSLDKENDHPSAALRIKAPAGMNSAATVISTTSSNTGFGFESVATADIAGVNLQVDTASSGMQLGINGTDSASSLSGRDTPASSENGGMWLVGLQSAMNNRQQLSVVSGNGPLSTTSSTRTDGIMSTSGFSVPLMHANPGMGENIYINNKNKIVSSYSNAFPEPNFYAGNSNDGINPTNSNNYRRALSTIGQQNGSVISSSSSSSTMPNTVPTSNVPLMASGSTNNIMKTNNNGPQRVPINQSVPTRALQSLNTANVPEANIVNAPYAPSSNGTTSSNKAPFTVWNDSYNNINNNNMVGANSVTTTNTAPVDEDVQMRSPRAQVPSSSAFRPLASSNTNTNGNNNASSSTASSSSTTGTTIISPSTKNPAATNNAALHQETLRNIYDTLTFTVQRNASTAPRAPKIWVTQWLDYSAKYGLGYLLSNGTVGIHFNDGTKILISPDGTRFEYIERLCPSQPPTIPGITCYVGTDGFTRFCGSVSEFPENYRKKVTLVRFYRSYLFDQYERRKLYTKGRITKEEVFVNSTTGMFADLFKGSDQDQVSYVPLPITQEEERSMATGTTSAYRMGSIPFIKKWIRSRRGVMFRFSNQHVQVASNDGSNLILSGDGAVSTYIEASGKRYVMNTQTALSSVHDHISSVASPGSRMVDNHNENSNVPAYMEEAVQRIQNAQHILASFVTPSTVPSSTTTNANTNNKGSNEEHDGYV